MLVEVKVLEKRERERERIKGKKGEVGEDNDATSGQRQLQHWWHCNGRRGKYGLFRVMQVEGSLCGVILSKKRKQRAEVGLTW